MEHHHLDRIAQLVVKYYQNKLTLAEREELNQWLAQTPENRAFFRAFDDQEARAQDLAFYESIDPEKGWEQFVSKNQQLSLGKTKRPAWIPWQYAAAIVLLVSGILWFYAPIRHSETPSPSLAQLEGKDILPGGKKAELILSDGKKIDLVNHPLDNLQEHDGTRIAQISGTLQYLDSSKNEGKPLYNTLHVPQTGMYNLVLADGTKVWVNSLSQLTFPVHFTEKERRVSLQGEAYFEVAKDEKRPFIIDTRGTSIEVLGTHLNVNTYDRATTTLIEGSVRVHSGKKAAMLHPGEQARVNTQGEFRIRQADIRKTLAWKNGEFYFKSDDLSKIMDQLSRWYGVEIRYQGGVPTHMGYHGNIPRNSMLSEVLEMLSFATGTEMTIQDTSIVVKLNSH